MSSDSHELGRLAARVAIETARAFAAPPRTAEAVTVPVPKMVEVPPAVKPKAPRARRKKQAATMPATKPKAPTGVKPPSRARRKRKAETVPEAEPEAPTPPVVPPPSHPRRPVVQDWHRGWGRLHRYADQLGKVHDIQIAEVAGVSLGTVDAYRSALGIVPYDDAQDVVAPKAKAIPLRPIGPGRRKGVPAVPAPTESTPPTLTNAYELVARTADRERRFYLLGTDLVEVCERAKRAVDALADGPWHFGDIRKVGEGIEREA